MEKRFFPCCELLRRVLGEVTIVGTLDLVELSQIPGQLRFDLIQIILNVNNLSPWRDI